MSDLYDENPAIHAQNVLADAMRNGDADDIIAARKGGSRLAKHATAEEREEARARWSR
jgi:hypothetical protein